jgi:hypothetical protein
LDAAVPLQYLSRTFYLKGVAQYYEKNWEEAAKYWRQAILYDRTLQWDDNIEPSGKETFEGLKSELKLEANATLSLYPANADILMDGSAVQNGALVLAGRHLVQYQKEKYKNYWIQVDAGSDISFINFSSYPNDLPKIMSQEASRDALLYSLQEVQPIKDVQVLEQGTIWKVPLGGDKWVSAKYNPNTKLTQDIATAPTEFRLEPRVPVLVAGTVTLFAGGYAFWRSKQSHDAYMEEKSFATGLELEEATNNAWMTGVGLSVVGIGFVVGGFFRW